LESIGNLNKIGSKRGQNLQASNLLVINYAMDEKSQVFSHQIELVNQLSAKFDQVTVLTAQVGVCNTEKNVKVISFDWVEGKRVSSLIRFLKIFVKTIRSEKFTVLFSHMTSVQSAFISPITRVIKLKHYLWFAHTSNSILLKVSRLLSNGIITSTPGSCPLKGSKVYPIGQSINSQKFKKKSSNTQPVKNLLHIGRFDPSKNIKEIVYKVKKLRSDFPDLKLEVIGSPSSDRFKDYESNVKAKFDSEVQLGWLKFTPHIPRSSLPEILQTYDCFIHSFQGSLDKTIVEATFSGLPVITINNEYRKIFGSWNLINTDMNNSLKDEAQLLLNLDGNKRQSEVDRRYKVAIEQHELTGWIDRLVSILKSR
jgi:glycosyltransferase involved in cell wall biosynthesis